MKILLKENIVEARVILGNYSLVKIFFACSNVVKAPVKVLLQQQEKNILSIEEICLVKWMRVKDAEQ